MAEIKINSGMEKPELISQKTKEILQIAANLSNNPVITINSGIRSQHRQATAMYDNLRNGKRIRYAAPGREVTAVFDANKARPKNDVINLMVAKIEELAKQNRLVSKHCVTIEQYKKNNIVDCSKHIPNPRDFVKELIKDNSVTKIITPFNSNYNNSKVIVDFSEPAIHVEILQI